MTISADDRRGLVSLARLAVKACVAGTVLPIVHEKEGVFAEKRGCFVTLTNQGQLRGCIGTFKPSDPLGESIVEMAASAANDPRFVNDPITADEVPDLNIEVSVLSPLELTEHPEQLELGKHGIYITCGFHSGCFLPEVATDHHMSVDEFLSSCCLHKAGLPPDAWKFPECNVYLFTSEKFS